MPGRTFPGRKNGGYGRRESLRSLRAGRDERLVGTSHVQAASPKAASPGPVLFQGLDDEANGKPHGRVRIQSFTDTLLRSCLAQGQDERSPDCATERRGICQETALGKTRYHSARHFRSAPAQDGSARAGLGAFRFSTPGSAGPSCRTSITKTEEAAAHDIRSRRKRSLRISRPTSETPSQKGRPPSHNTKVFSAPSC